MEGHASSSRPMKNSGYMTMPVRLPGRTFSTHQYRPMAAPSSTRPPTSSQRGARGYRKAATRNSYGTYVISTPNSRPMRAAGHVSGSSVAVMGGAWSERGAGSGDIFPDSRVSGPMGSSARWCFVGGRTPRTTWVGHLGSGDFEHRPLAHLPRQRDFDGVARLAAHERAAHGGGGGDDGQEAVAARARQLRARAHRQHEEGALGEALFVLGAHVHQGAQAHGPLAREARHRPLAEVGERLELLLHAAGAIRLARGKAAELQRGAAVLSLLRLGGQTAGRLAGLGLGPVGQPIALLEALGELQHQCLLVE